VPIASPSSWTAKCASQRLMLPAPDSDLGGRSPMTKAPGAAPRLGRAICLARPYRLAAIA
jgi:hypothetical protein